MYTFDPLHLPGGWSVWLHPRRYAALIEALCADKSTDADRIAILEKILAEQRRDSAAMAMEKTELAAKLTDAQRETDFLQRELEKTREMLDEAGSVDRKLDEFSAQLEGFENLKRKYEKTIRTLRLQLRDARSTIKALSGEVFDNELSALPSATTRKSATHTDPTHIPADKATAGSGAENAPQTPAADDIEDSPAVVPKIVFSRTAPKKTSPRDDDSDWLLTLPPDV